MKEREFKKKSPKIEKKIGEFSADSMKSCDFSEAIDNDDFCENY